MELKCIIVDDEPIAISILEDYIRMTPFLKLDKSFDAPMDCLQYLQDHAIDLLFLDINMPDLSGIQLLNVIKTPPMVIFTTAYSEYAVKSYDLNAIDYLMKPIEFDRFLKAVTKAFEKFKLDNNEKAEKRLRIQDINQIYTNPKDHIFIKSGNQQVKLKFSEILYIEGAKNYVLFITETKKLISYLTMKETEQLLKEHHFLRIHKSYIVSIKKIDVVENNRVFIKKFQVPVSMTYRKALQEKLK